MNSIEPLAFNALQEFSTGYNNRLNKEASLMWLNSHSALYDRRIEFLLNSIAYRSFFSIYSELQHLVDYLQYTGMCEKALLDFGEISIQEDAQLLDWLVIHEDFGLSMEIFYVTTCFQHTENEKDGYFSLIGEPSIMVKTLDYSSIIDFLGVFSLNYWVTIAGFALREENSKNIAKRDLYYGPVSMSLKEYISTN